jgi:hypothetical protein
MLTIDTIPLCNFGFRIWDFGFAVSSNPKSDIRNPKSIYLFSLCGVWQRQRRQNFLNSSLLGVVFLFFVVT